MLMVEPVSNTSSADQAVATAVSYLFRSLGSVVGLSLAASVVQQSLRFHLRENLNSGSEADEIVRRVLESLDYVKTLEPWLQDLVRNSYEKALRAGFAMNILIVSGAMFSAYGIREKKLSR